MPSLRKDHPARRRKQPSYLEREGMPHEPPISCPRKGGRFEPSTSEFENFHEVGCMQTTATDEKYLRDHGQCLYKSNHQLMPMKDERQAKKQGDSLPEKFPYSACEARAPQQPRSLPLGPSMIFQAQCPSSKPSGRSYLSIESGIASSSS